MSTLHVGLLAREYDPQVDRGGIGAYTRHLALGLRQLGHRVTILSEAAGPGAPESATSLSAARRIASGLLTRARQSPNARKWLPGRAAAMLWYSFVLAQRVRAIDRREPFDILEAPDWGGEGFVLSQWKSAPFVVKLHSPSFVLRPFNHAPRSIDHHLVDFMEKTAILDADLITCPSRNLARMVSSQFQLPQERIHIVRYPVDHHFFSPALQPKDGPETILYVGRLNRLKGVHTLARAVSCVARAWPSARFLFAGPDMLGSQPGQTVKQELLNILSQHRVTDRVRFLPSQTRLELLSLYRASDICVVPSLYDNLPFACLEAMACGKAVVASQVGGLPETIHAGENGLLVPPDHPEALAEALIALLQDRQRRQALGQNARAYIEANFSCVAVAEKTVELYSQIVRRASVVPSTLTLNMDGDGVEAQ